MCLEIIIEGISLVLFIICENLTRILVKPIESGNGFPASIGFPVISVVVAAILPAVLS